VYICGGSHPSIEKFDPLTLTFTQVYDLTSKISGVIAFSFNETLYLIGVENIWKGNALEIVPRASRLDGARWWDSLYGVSLIGNFCFFLEDEECVRLDMRTLTETSYPITKQ
jgi:hypothetical protein